MPTGTKNTLIPGCGTHHIALQTLDLEASLKLYRDVLGMRETVGWEADDGQKIMLLDMGDGSFMELFGPKRSDPVAKAEDAPNYPVIHVALATTDARQATERVRAAGYEITVEPKDVNLGGLEVTIAFFKGPSGEVLEFFETHD